MKKMFHSAVVLLLLAILNTHLTTVRAQSTAFTYQGRLDHGSNRLDVADMTFTLFTTNTGGSPVGGPITNAAVLVNSNDLFMTTIDFGASPFTGTTTNWLEIGVRTNGVGAFTILTPRQLITPTPQSIYALNASTAAIAMTAASADSVLASNISGTIPTAMLGSGTASGTTFLAGNQTWATPTFSMSVRTNYALSDGTMMSASFAHGLGTTPSLLRMVLVCSATDSSGFTAGQEIDTTPITSGYPEFSVYADAVNIYIYYNGDPGNTCTVVNQNGVTAFGSFNNFKLKVYYHQ